MIKELFLKNFRGIKTGHLKDFSRINIFLGPNNSGKSTILESLYLISSVSESEIIYKNKKMQGYIPKKDYLGYDPLIRLWEKHGISEWEKNRGKLENGLVRVNVGGQSWKISPQKKEVRSSFELKDEDKIGYCGVNYSKKELSTSTQSYSKDWLHLALTEKEIELLPEKGRINFLWFQIFIYEDEKIAAVAADITGNPFPDVFFFDCLTSRELLKSQFVENILSSCPGWLDEIRERFNNIFPIGILQIAFTPQKENPNIMRASIVPQGKTAISVDLLGNGAHSMFKFICFLTALNNESIVIWEYPELSQHTETLERSLTEIVKIIKEKNLQVFLSTQSYEGLGLLSTMIEKGLLSSDEIRAFYTELREGILGYRPFTGETLSGWIEMELDPRRRDQFSGKLIYKIKEEE